MLSFFKAHWGILTKQILVFLHDLSETNQTENYLFFSFEFTLKNHSCPPSQKSISSPPAQNKLSSPHNYVRETKNLLKKLLCE